jgi:hypothetical protein
LSRQAVVRRRDRWAVLALAIFATAGVCPLGRSTRCLFVASTFLDSPTGSRASSHNGHMDERTPPLVGVVPSFYSSRQTSGDSRVVDLVADGTDQIAPHSAAQDSRVRDVRPPKSLPRPQITTS